MRAMILAAGYGTRLFPLTADRAKPALPFLNRPLVGYVAEYLARFGVRDVLVNLHHQGDSVRRALGDGSRFGVNTHFIEEPEILGTSGALDNARELLDTNTFIAINGKIITDIDLSLALETHRRTNALATLVLRRNTARERFTIVETDGELLTGFGGMPHLPSDNDLEVNAARSHGAIVNASDNAPLMFTGIQILEPRIFDYIPRRRFSHTTTDVYLPALKNGERIAAHIAEAGKWYELSTLQRYLGISLELCKSDAAVQTNLQTARHQNSHNRDGVIAGENSIIENGATVEDAILWRDCFVEAKAEVRRTVLGDGVRVRAGERYEDVVVVRAELVRANEIPSKALPGHFAGVNFVVPLRG
ncbi:MAG: NDP-sugar synthase [Pyrinomonadaceae bacterium MAG19_C2-C3]|nr:NDP-sugar synthase [Pyrinomonadaceae bacterium MAG19_C2-C3]